MQFLENNHIKETIASMVVNNKKASSFLIHGSAGLGKRTAAKHIAAAYLCEQQTGTPCGKCSSCRKVFENIHPDIKILAANANGNYTADSLRDFVSDVYIKPNEGDRKFYILPNLDLSIQTCEILQNILLKVFEEPPRTAVFIITATSLDNLLPTIISRASCLEVLPLSLETTLEYLKEKYNFTGEEAMKTAIFSGGNLSHISADPESEFAAVQKTANNLLNSIYARSEYDVLKNLLEINDRAKLKMVLAQLEYMTEISIKSCLETENRLKATQAFSDKLGLNRLLSLAEKLKKHRRLADSNRQLGLALCDLAADIID